MMRRTCVQCGKAFWTESNWLATRQNLTCKSADCRRKQKTMQQRKRRAARTKARLAAKHLAEVRKLGSKRGPMKHIALQHKMRFRKAA